MTSSSMTAQTTVENDYDATLFEYLDKYGYLLRQPNGYRWLAGFLRGEALQHARAVIEARYPPTQPALYVVAHKREKRAMKRAA
jgi:hypothetical protein